MTTELTIRNHETQNAITTSLDDDEVKALRTFIEYLQIATGGDMTTTGVAACEKFLWLIGQWSNDIGEDRDGDG